MAVEKIKKDKKTLFLELERNPDIIAQIGKNKGNRVLIGFAMETQNLLANAAEKLKEKNMDLIVANDLKEEGAGFRIDTNIITIIDRTGKSEAFGKMTKIEAAGEILNRVKKIINRKGDGKN
jgi:phosphopantothenoylcysteine decarboxylase/phosphopantothenate--cysteine ligase